MFDINKAAADPKITIEAYAILSYLNQYSQGLPICAPSRNRITKSLKISKTRFYKHLNLLIDNGYIAISKHNFGTFPQNQYSNPSCPHFEDIIVNRVLKTGTQRKNNVIWLENCHNRLREYRHNVLNSIGKHPVPGYASPIINKQDDMKQAGR